MSVVCCQVEASATGQTLVQRNPTECGVVISTPVSGYRYRGPGFDPRRYQIF